MAFEHSVKGKKNRETAGLKETYTYSVCFCNIINFVRSNRGVHPEAKTLCIMSRACIFSPFFHISLHKAGKKE